MMFKQFGRHAFRLFTFLITVVNFPYQTTMLTKGFGGNARYG